MGSELPADIDAECRELCEAMNLLPGIQTFESCCGHGKYPYRVWFHASSVKDLPRLIYWFDPCHSGKYGWRVEVGTDCAMSPAYFMVEGPISDYESAQDIAGLIREEATVSTTALQETDGKN